MKPPLHMPSDEVDLGPLQPFDEHNKRLQQNVHPSDWTNPTPSGRYNLVVIGAGTAGLVAAAGAAGLGAKVALIERELMGGDCLNVGCVPSKGIIRSARAAAALRTSGEFGVDVSSAAVDFSRVMQRMRRLRANISPHDSAFRFRDLGIDVYLGQGQFVDSNSIDVDGTKLSYEKAVIATGARAAAPPIAGLDQVSYLTNETIFSLTELPPRLGIVGAGPIGCEMAQTFAELGSEVYLIESADHVLPREDADAAGIVQRCLKASGVNVLCCGRELQITAGKPICLRGNSKGNEYEHHVDQLLVAVGRAPNIESLNLAAVGVNHDKHGVTVNDRLQTTNRNIYAAGDVCSKYKFTHAADFMARIVIQNALFFGRAKASHLTIPWCTYTSPEVAHVGLYPHEAKEQGIEIDTYMQQLADVDRAILEGDVDGFVKVHAKKGKDTIVGSTIVAANAGDMISQMSLAMTHKLGLGDFAKTIYPYPTQAEAIRKLGDQYNRTRLTPFVKGLMTRWLSWRR